MQQWVARMLCIALLTGLFGGGYKDGKQPRGEAPAAREESATASSDDRAAVARELTGDYLNGESPDYLEAFTRAYNAFADEHGAERCAFLYGYDTPPESADAHVYVLWLGDLDESDSSPGWMKLTVYPDRHGFTIEHQIGHDADMQAAAARYSAVLSAFHPDMPVGEVRAAVDRWMAQGGTDAVEAFGYNFVYLAYFQDTISFMTWPVPEGNVNYQAR